MEISSEGASEARLGVEECLALLSTQAVGRLVYEQPDVQIRPMNYMVIGDEIVVRTEHAAPLPEYVAFEVDQIDPIDRQGWSVVVRGRARVVPVAEVDMAIRERLAPWAPGSMLWTIWIEIDRVSGRWVRSARTHVTFDERGYM